MRQSAVVCLMGPTASGKTELAVRLCERFPFDIVSVDSALVYRHMNIGTAKPDRATLEKAPHRLIDIRDPEQAYSAGDFVQDAAREIADIHSRGRVPLLVGGTMLYFRSLTEGIADLPPADPAVRAKIEREAERSGWPGLHERLQRLDPATAARIDRNDRQRIQRALEVYSVSGEPLSRWHERAADSGPGLDFLKLALVPGDRAALHARIERRLDAMFRQGFVDEVKLLMNRRDLRPDHPSMRSVGYRQVWSCLAGDGDLETARYRALVATRQLAKRQLTWLRGDQNLLPFDPLEADPTVTISTAAAKWLDE